MKINNIIKDFENLLLKRRETEISMSADKNLGFDNSLKLVAEQFKVQEEQIVIKAIRSQFGKSEFLIDAFVYDSLQDKERFEPKKKINEKADAEAATGAGGKK